MKISLSVVFFAICVFEINCTPIFQSNFNPAPSSMKGNKITFFSYKYLMRFITIERNLPIYLSRDEILRELLKENPIRPYGVRYENEALK